MNSIVEDTLNKLRQCDDFHNRCDCLLEHSEITYLLEYIQKQDKEIERLKKREQECIDHYLVQCKYASEMEDKYITANYVINELEKWLDKEINQLKLEDNYEDADTLEIVQKKLQELKGVDKE